MSPYETSIGSNHGISCTGAQAKKRGRSHDKPSPCLTEEPRIVCLQCGEVFDKKSKMSRHVINHLAINYLIDAFSCIYCECSMSRRDNMSAHVKTKHSNKPLVCEII